MYWRNSKENTWKKNLNIHKFTFLQENIRIIFIPIQKVLKRVFFTKNIYLFVLTLIAFSQTALIQAIKGSELESGSQEDKVEDFLGIETLNSESLKYISIPRTVYVGQCPGEKNGKTEGYFVDYNTPVAPNLVVKLENYARGLSPQKPPYTVRDYDQGRASEKIKFKFGTEHNKVNFIVREGLNPIKYQIIDETNRRERVVLKSGMFMLKVGVDQTVYKRNMEYSDGSYYCPLW